MDERKTVPLWQAIQHMQEEEVVYFIESLAYRYHEEHGFQYDYFGEWRQPTEFYKLPLDTDCVLLPHIDYHTGKSKLEQPQPIKLTPWAGGEMPVELLTPLLVKHRSGSFFCVPAGGMQARGWVHVNRPDDIIAYAVVKIEGQTE